MNGLNFFSWIRDGVRQSVLLGVSDAVEQLGVPPSGEELHPSVVGLLQEGQSSGGNTKSMAAGQRSSRKRLGKSLKDLDAAGQ